MRGGGFPKRGREGEALGDEAAEAAQVEKGRELRAVAEGPRRGEHRIAQRDAARDRRGCRRKRARSRQAVPVHRRGVEHRAVSTHERDSHLRAAAPRSRDTRRTRTPCGSRGTRCRSARARRRARRSAASSAWGRRRRRGRRPPPRARLRAAPSPGRAFRELPSSVAICRSTPRSSKSSTPIRSAAVRAPSRTETADSSRERAASS